jgi:adenylate kinase family enzyme
MPVVDMFEKDGKVVKISAVGDVGEVYEHVVEGLASMGISPSN